MSDFSQPLNRTSCSVHYESRAAKGTGDFAEELFHMTKNPNNTGEMERAHLLEPVISAEFKKSRCGGGFFDSGFLECLGEVANQLSTRNTRMRERFGFF